MSSKVLRQIIAVLLGAVVGWGLLASWQRQKHETDNANALALPALTPKTTDTVRYTGPQDTIILARNDSTWTVNGQPAGLPVVDAFFRAANDSSARSELIAESEASHQRLGVDSAQARRLVVIGGGKTLVDYYFGGRGPDFEGFYVRQANGPRVYLLRGTFANLTTQGLDDWRDKTLAMIPRDRVGHVDVTAGRIRYQLTRSGSKFTIMNGIADSAKVFQYLGNFTALRGTGFPRPEQRDSATFAPAERVVEVFSNSSRSLGRLELDSMSWGWMVRTGGGALYKLDQRTVDLLTPQPDSLLKR